jgi:hypothetical protein
MPWISSRGVRITIELPLRIPQHLSPDNASRTLHITLLVLKFRTALLRTDSLLVLLASAVCVVASEFKSVDMSISNVLELLKVRGVAARPCLWQVEAYTVAQAVGVLCGRGVGDAGCRAAVGVA